MRRLEWSWVNLQGRLGGFLMGHDVVLGYIAVVCLGVRVCVCGTEVFEYWSYLYVIPYCRVAKHRKVWLCLQISEWRERGKENPGRSYWIEDTEKSS